MKDIVLNRFTTIEKMLGIVRTEEILMSDPSYWEDRNDALLMELYQAKKHLAALYAVCFTQGDETIYHWSAFTQKSEACCIEYFADDVIAEYSAKPGWTARAIEYVKINEMKHKVKEIGQIPFVKRYPYRNEDEFRIIFESSVPVKRPSLKISRRKIRKITINQHLPVEIFDMIKKSIELEWAIDVRRSTVVKNDRWIGYMRRL